MSSVKGSVVFTVILTKCADWRINTKQMSAIYTETSYSPTVNLVEISLPVSCESSASTDANGVYSFTGIE